MKPREICVNHFLRIPQSLPSRRVIGDNARGFRHFGEKMAILFAPVNDDFVSVVDSSLLRLHVILSKAKNL